MGVMNICELEMFLNNPIFREENKKIEISTEIEGEDIAIGIINLDKNKLEINKEFVKIKKEKNKRTRVILDNKSYLVNALMRAAILKPDFSSQRRTVSQWDDVIFGLDTNLFYNCVITTSLLDNLLKITSGDFLDTPDWVTLVFSKVGMGEIENRANRSKNPVHRREAYRAIQEFMIINKAKDLEGVSLFLTGSIPPEMRFSDGSTNTIRDSTIREHFRFFLKNLDFHKGSYFLTQDFNNAVLAEAEGLLSMYIRKPKLDKMEFDLFKENKVNISELLYELSVAFKPLIIKSDGLKFEIKSNWRGKTLEEWEKWQIKLNWLEDKNKIKPKIKKWKKKKTPKKMMKGWKKLRERYVEWEV